MVFTRVSGKTTIRRMACKDTGNKCDAVFEGQNDDRVVVEAIEHLAQTHGEFLTPDLAARVRTLIKSVSTFHP